MRFGLVVVGVIVGGLAADWPMGVRAAVGQSMAVEAKPSFEVATIKPSNPANQNTGFHLAGHRIFIENETANTLIAFAYGVHTKQIVGGPAWLSTERFDIKGMPDVEGTPSLKQMQGMVQKLLADRFHFRLHHEQQEIPVYAVVVASKGAKLEKSSADPNGLADETGNGRGLMRFTNSSMRDFAREMQVLLDRPVLDKTGLTGRFNYTLRFTPDDAPPSDNSAPGLFTAIQEELGLKIEPTKSLEDVIVIDRIEQPSPN